MKNFRMIDETIIKNFEIKEFLAHYPEIDWKSVISHTLVEGIHSLKNKFGDIPAYHQILIYHEEKT